jgi:hypothetical protein
MPTPLLQDLFHETLARYIAVRPTGLQIGPGPLVASLTAQILTFRPARTLYQNKQPTCRSLDGIQSLQQGRACAACLMRKACTPQIYLELLADNLPLRLILAYSSARNFMTFVSRLRTQHQPIENAHIIISVRDRGRWGELHFISEPLSQPH